MPGPKPVHLLSDISNDSASCAKCGPVEVVHLSAGPRCLNKVKEDRARANASRRKKRAEDPEWAERKRKYHREYARLAAFRIDAAQVLSAVDSACEICGKRLTVETMRIDHDHDCCTTKPTCGACTRGILCNACNAGLGLLGDRLESLERAVAYLAAYETRKQMAS